jgi:hypothetical protein
MGPKNAMKPAWPGPAPRQAGASGLPAELPLHSRPVPLRGGLVLVVEGLPGEQQALRWCVRNLLVLGWVGGGGRATLRGGGVKRRLLVRATCYSSCCTASQPQKGA